MKFFIVLVTHKRYPRPKRRPLGRAVETVLIVIFSYDIDIVADRDALGGQPGVVIVIDAEP